jgi:uncharacterized protein (TIGR02118 family)
MKKALFLVTRRDDMDHEEFVEYWQSTHVPLATQHPGLLKYATSVPDDPERAPFDGVAELYFESAEALQAGLVESEVGERAKEDALAFADPEASTMVVLEETVHLDETD